MAFAINEKGYVGLGYADSALKDFWQYDPSTGQWKRIADFPGDGRYGAVTFSLKQKAYVGLGSNGDSLLDDFWQYDPSTGQWKRIADFGGSPRINSVGFTANGKGFVGTGDGKNKGSRKDFWKYDPVSNKWNRISGFKGGERRLAVGFSIGDKGYIGTGIGPHLHNKKDFWCINPDSIKESTSIALIKIKRKRACYIFPNPIYNSNRVYLHCKPHNKIPEQISLYNMQGKKATFTGIQQSKFKNPSNEMKLTIDIPASFSPGVYFVEIKFDSSIEYHKLILE